MERGGKIRFVSKYLCIKAGTFLLKRYKYMTPFHFPVGAESIADFFDLLSNDPCSYHTCVIKIHDLFGVKLGLKNCCMFVWLVMRTLGAK